MESLTSLSRDYFRFQWLKTYPSWSTYATNYIAQNVHKYLDCWKHVKKKIKNMLPPQIAMIFHDSTWGSEYYCAVFATFPFNYKQGYKAALLTLSPLVNEGSQNADSHIEVLKFVLDLFWKTFENAAALVEDNCPTNKAFATQTGRNFVCSSSHGFNLAVRDITSDHAQEIAKVHALMKTLRTDIAAAKIR